jgi:hypothetical protein
MTTHIRAVFVTIVVFALMVSPRAAAETTRCTAITILPSIINAPGTYCLLTDLTTSMSGGTAITINASSVTLDLNGHKLAGTAGAGTLAWGIYASDRKFIVVRNGTVRGFQHGVILRGLGNPGSSIVEDIVAEKNFFVGIKVDGTGNVVRRNLVVNTGGTTTLPNYAIGILSEGGTDNVFRDNQVVTVVGRGTGVGYGISVLSSNTVIERNQIVNTHTGIRARAANTLVSDNRVLTAELGIWFSGAGSGKYRNNLTTAVTTLASGGTDAGGNN